MTAYFDLCAIALLGAAAGLYIFRLRTERPPSKPYIIALASCALGYWIGSAGAILPGTVILVTVGFWLVNLAGEPFSDDGQVG